MRVVFQVGEEVNSCQWWYVGGLGARGLVYHAMLAEIVAEAVLSGDESVVPEELRFNPMYDPLA